MSSSLLIYLCRPPLCVLATHASQKIMNAPLEIQLNVPLSGFVVAPKYMPSTYLKNLISKQQQQKQFGNFILHVPIHLSFCHLQCFHFVTLPNQSPNSPSPHPLRISFIQWNVKKKKFVGCQIFCTSLKIFAKQVESEMC